MLRKPDKRDSVTDKHVKPNEGERTLLSSNESGNRSPFLGFNPNNPLVIKEMAMDYLADILVEIFLAEERKKHAEQTGSDLLQGINKRTG